MFEDVGLISILGRMTGPYSWIALETVVVTRSKRPKMQCVANEFRLIVEEGHVRSLILSG